MKYEYLNGTGLTCGDSLASSVIDEFTERCFWYLNGLQEVAVYGTPFRYWSNCINVCQGLPIDINKDKHCYLSNCDVVGLEEKL